VTDSSLQDDLLAIAGVEGAEVEGSADKPAGLRIRIAEGADQHAVGGAIRRVLTAHGLGTDTRLPGEVAASAPIAAVPSEAPIDDDSEDHDPAGAPAPSPVAVATADSEVIDLTDDAPDDVEDELVPDDEAPLPDMEDAPEDDLDDEPVLDDGWGDAPAPLEDTRVAPTIADMPRRRVAPAGNGGIARIASVAVEEGREGIVVTVVASDGTEVRQPAASSEGGVESAVVRATAKLAFPEAPEAIVIDVEDRRVEGVDIVMIVLDVNGAVQAGSAVVGAGRAFALARATWAALQL
jgi:hypothetical protein